MPGGGTRLGEEVRDGPHNNYRCGGNRGGVAPTTAPLRPRAGVRRTPAFILPLAVLYSHPLGRGLRFGTLSALRGTSGGETMTTPGGARTPPRDWHNSNRARRTGFYHGSELPRWLRYGTPALRFAPLLSRRVLLMYRSSWCT
jgi:hypothetical protein